MCSRLVDSSDRRVLISIDDTSLLAPLGDVSRAQSLNRLDEPEERKYADNELHSNTMYKCPSFPRLPGRITPDARTFSTTHVETDSLSPRVSSDNLDCDWDKDHLSLGGPVTLVRSVSARAMDSLQSADCSERNQSHFLSPNEALTSRVERSTSCPMMACSARDSSSSLSPDSARERSDTPSPQKDHAIETKNETPSKDVDSPPPVISGVVCSSPRHSADSRLNRRDKSKSGFVNIGDMPTTMTQRVISEKHGLGSLPSTERNVKAKCLQWLNSLDQDTDNEGDC